MNVSKIILIISILVAPYIGYSQTLSVQKSEPLSVAKPESVGVSSDRLKRIDDMCKEMLGKDKIPGVTVLIARKGKIVYHKAFGMADNQKGRELKKNDIFRLGSMTKAITATAAMMLWEEGKFNLDQNISDFIPEFKNMEVIEDFNPKDSSYTSRPAKSGITIRELLTHTAGLGYGKIDDSAFSAIYAKAGIVDLATTKYYTLEENVKRMAKLPLHSDPGTEFHYAEGLDVIARLIEIVSGERFDHFLQKHIFKPLGMKDTWFYVPDSLASRLVPVQYKKDGKWIHFPGKWYDTEFPIKGAKRFFDAGGGLSSTPYDYATFLQMYLNGGELNGIRLLSRRTINLILSMQFPSIWNNHDKFYGLAFEVVTDKGAAKGGFGNAGTFGWAGYFDTYDFADPKEQLIGIMMKQIDPQVVYDDSNWKFRTLVEQTVDN